MKLVVFLSLLLVYTALVESVPMRESEEVIEGSLENSETIGKFWLEFLCSVSLSTKLCINFDSI